MSIDGPGIIDGDFACDIEADFFERFDAKNDPAVIREELIEEYEGEILSDADREIFLTTLAECLWRVGLPTDDLAAEVRNMLEADRTAEYWDEMYADRKKALKRFLTKLKKPKKKPLHPQKRRAPWKHLFDDGDYLLFTRQNGKQVPVIMWGTDRIVGLMYNFIFPNLTRTNDEELLRKFLVTSEPISDDELATFFSKNKRTKVIGIEHRVLKPNVERFRRFGNRELDTRVWQASSYGSCARSEDLEQYINQGGSRGLTKQELEWIGMTGQAGS